MNKLSPQSKQIMRSDFYRISDQQTTASDSLLPEIFF